MLSGVGGSVSRVCSCYGPLLGILTDPGVQPATPFPCYGLLCEPLLCGLLCAERSRLQFLSVCTTSGPPPPCTPYIAFTLSQYVPAPAPARSSEHTGLHLSSAAMAITQGLHRVACKARAARPAVRRLQATPLRAQRAPAVLRGSVDEVRAPPPVGWQHECGRSSIKALAGRAAGAEARGATSPRQPPHGEQCTRGRHALQAGVEQQRIKQARSNVTRRIKQLGEQGKVREAIQELAGEATQVPGGARAAGAAPLAPPPDRRGCRRGALGRCSRPANPWLPPPVV